MGFLLAASMATVAESPPRERRPIASYQVPLAQILGIPFDGNHFDELLAEEQKRFRDWQKEHPVTFYVAFMPDPADAQLAHAFDAEITAIQQAFSQEGYLLDHFSPDLVAPQHEPPSTPRDLQPSLIIFRPPAQPAVPLVRPDEWVFLFIVREVPTFGADQASFASAVRYVKELLSRCPSRLHIIGPSFSGGQHSLEDAISNWECHKRTELDVVSGSATGLLPLGSHHSALTKLPNIHLRATVLQDSELIPRMIGVMRDELRVDRFVVLTEGNTGYGRDVSERIQRALKSDETLVFLPFPLHISEIGVARQRQAESRPRDNSSLPPESFHQLLQLEFDDKGHEPRGVIPATSSLSKHSAELVVANMVALIARAGVRFVGILATDARDKIFLAQEIKKFDPDLTVFTTEGDLLFTHSDLANELRGTIVASSYPLYTLNQNWSFPFGFHGGVPTPRVQMQSSAAQGIYNATIAALDGSSYLEYGIPFDESPRGPGMWLSITGGHGFWPMHAEASYGRPSWAYAVPTVKLDGKVPLVLPPGRLLRTLGIVLAIFILLLAILSRSAASADAAGLRLRAFAWSLLFLVMAGFTGPLLAVWNVRVDVLALRSRFDDPGITMSGWNVVGTAVSLLASLVAATMAGFNLFFLAWRYLEQMVTHVERAPSLFLRLAGSLRPWSGVFSFLLAALGFRQLVAPFYASAVDNALFSARAMALSSGISPVLPLLTGGLAIGVIVCAQLARHRQITIHLEENAGGPRQYFLEDPGRPLDFSKTVNAARAILNDAPEELGSRAALVGTPALVTVVLLLASPFHATLEGPGWNALSSYLFLLTAVSVAVTYTQFLLIWLHFRRFLQQLLFHPVMSVLRRMKELFGQMLGLHPYATSPRISELQLASFARCLALSPRISPARFALPSARADASSAKTRRRVLAVARSLMPVLLWDETSPSAGEEMIAVEVAIGIARVLAHLRNLLTAMTVSALLLLVYAHSYPFQPTSLLNLVAGFLITVVLFTALIVFIDMEKDPVFSAMTGSEAGRITWDGRFILQLVLYVAVPFIGLLSIRFPFISNGLVDWIQPLVRSLH